MYYLVENKKIIFLSSDYLGIGNRIKMLASFHVCFGLEDSLFFWLYKGWVNERFEKLFILKNIRGVEVINHPISLGLISSNPSKKEFSERGWWRLYVETNFFKSQEEILLSEYEFLGIDFHYEKIPQNIRNIYLDFFEKLLPSEHVLKRINEVQIEDHFVCVFVRNSCNSEDHAWVAPLEKYFQIMREYPQDVYFFLSCMDLKISHKFREIFGQRIVEIPKKDYRSMLDAVADMYLLGMGSELIISHGSTFCEVAWWLGGAKQKVVTVFPEYKQGVKI